jgi:hypothetical protein
LLRAFDDCMPFYSYGTVFFGPKNMREGSMVCRVQVPSSLFFDVLVAVLDASQVPSSAFLSLVLLDVVAVLRDHPDQRRG